MRVSPGRGGRVSLPVTLRRCDLRVFRVSHGIPTAICLHFPGHFLGNSAMRAGRAEAGGRDEPANWSREWLGQHALVHWWGHSEHPVEVEKWPVSSTTVSVSQIRFDATREVLQTLATGTARAVVTRPSHAGALRAPAPCGGVQVAAWGYRCRSGPCARFPGGARRSERGPADGGYRIAPDRLVRLCRVVDAAPPDGPVPVVLPAGASASLRR